MKQIAVIGLGRFGRRLASTLSANGAEVLAIDEDPAVVQEVSGEVASAVCLDSTDEEALRAVKVDQVDIAVVAIGEDIEASILTVSLLAELNVPQIIARAVTPHQARILEKVGATRVVYPEDEVAVTLARTLVSEHVLDYFTLSPHLHAVRMEAPEKFWGKTLAELHLRARYGVSIVAIHRPTAPEEAQAIEINMPGGDQEIRKGDILVVLGAPQDIQRCERENF